MEEEVIETYLRDRQAKDGEIEGAIKLFNNNFLTSQNMMDARVTVCEYVRVSVHA